MNSPFKHFFAVIDSQKLFLFFINLQSIFIFSEPKYSVDISYLVSDFKYSQEHGLKICEVQHGSFSALDGDIYIYGEDGSITAKIADFFNSMPMKKWGIGLIYQPLKRALSHKNWTIEQSIKTVLNNPLFLKKALSPPVNPFSITSYSGIVYADFDVARNINYYQETYPGICFVNAVTFPYWKDKYKMNSLFDLTDDLKQYKADWRLYPKKYDPLLSKKIQEDMPSELYVIKPRSEVLAHGVIVVVNNELDHVLKMILQPLPSLEKHPDKKYSYWCKNKDDTFLIEKYYESDYLCFSCPLNQNTSLEAEYHYDATMRFVFILIYDQGKISYQCLGGFWKLPCKALEEEGSLNEKRISICKAPFYKAIDPILFREVDVQMEKAMLLLYEKMLN